LSNKNKMKSGLEDMSVLGNVEIKGVEATRADCFKVNPDK
jgi:hypothetical protein